MTAIVSNPKQHRRSVGRRVVHAALAVTKLAAAVVTRSTAMFSEPVHSVVDCGSEVLLLGYRRAAGHPDPAHPLGFGREPYFGSLVVLMLFALGAGASIYQGVHHVLAPEPIQHAAVSHAVPALPFVFEGAS